MTPPRQPNRLIHETSPYLRQHAHNPVDWYPWGEEALARARREHKPIFLSVGYSTCHWCHVMERESFEDPDIAAVLNEHFVCIKVDREERPDLDHLYMTATQATTGSGGWPMSVWLTPDLKPFYCGTYFPPQTRYGRPGFRELLLRIHEVWQANPDGIRDQAERLTAALARYTQVTGDGHVPDDTVVTQAVEQFRASYDPQHGGFGGAPKFPRPVALSFLMRTAGRDMALQTLRHMAGGGLFDHLGGGFHRYSVDERWLVPHFEKMLYDQAQLVGCYLEAFQLSGEAFFADIARRTCDYVLRDLLGPDGAFHAAEDADSEGVEGRFYVWTRAEIRAVLGDRAAEFCRAYPVTDAGNWEHGWNILHGSGWPAEREQLLAARAQRVRPHRDEKIITAWNGLMISALARAARVLGQPRYLAAAQRAARAVCRDGPLMRAGRARAVLDDHAFVMGGLVELYQTDFDPDWLARAQRLAEEMLKLFYDARAGGFFLDDGTDSSVLLRTKPDYDGAEPSGNSAATRALLRLAELTDRADFHDAAERTLQLFGQRLCGLPLAMPEMLSALQEYRHGLVQIVIAGNGGEELLAQVRRRHLPHAIVTRAGAPAWTAALPARDGRATAYVCVRRACRLPTSDPTELGRQLDALTDR